MCTVFYPHVEMFFLALFTSSVLCCFDLLQEGDGLVNKVVLEKEGMKVTSFIVIKEGNSGVDLAVSYENGDVEVHKVMKELAASTESEDDMLADRLSRFV